MDKAFCDKHPDTKPYTVCGDDRCPDCYWDDIMDPQPQVPAPPSGVIVQVYDPSKHRNVVTWKPRMDPGDIPA